MAANISILDPHFKLESWANQFLKFIQMSDENVEKYNGRKWTLIKNLFESVTNIPFNPSPETEISLLELMVCKIRIVLHDNRKIWNAKQDLIHLQILKNGLNHSPVADKEFIRFCIEKIDSTIKSFSTSSKATSSSSSSLVSRLKPIDAEINGSIQTPGGVNRYYASDNSSICERAALTIFLSVGIGYINIKTAKVVGELADFNMDKLQITALAEIAGQGSADQIEYFAKQLVLHLRASNFKDAVKIFFNPVDPNPHMSSEFALQLLVYEVYYHASSHSVFLRFLNQLMCKEEDRMTILPFYVLKLTKTLEREKTDENILSFIEAYFAGNKTGYSPILIARMIRDLVAKDIPRSSVICQVEDADIAGEAILGRIRKLFPNDWTKDTLPTDIVQEMTRFGTRWIWRFILNITNDFLANEISNLLYKLIPLNVRIIDELTSSVAPGASYTRSWPMRFSCHPREQLLELLLASNNLEAVALRGGGNDLHNLHAALLILSRNPNVCNIRELHVFGDAKDQSEDKYRITSKQLRATLCSPVFKHLKNLFICNPSNELINSLNTNLPFQLDKLTLFFAPDDSMSLPLIIFSATHDSLMVNLANSELLNSVQIVRIGYLNMNTENLLPLVNSPHFERLQELTFIGNRVNTLKNLLKTSLPTQSTHFDLETQTTRFLGSSAQVVKLKRTYTSPIKLASRWNICSILSHALASSCYQLWMRFGPQCG